jgi:hypothetical protein
MNDFQIWFYGSILLIAAGSVFTYVKNTFSPEIFNFIAFVTSIGYIILHRYTDGQWASIPLIWLGGMILCATLLLISQNKQLKTEPLKKKNTNKK